MGGGGGVMKQEFLWFSKKLGYSLFLATECNDTIIIMVHNAAASLFMSR